MRPCNDVTTYIPSKNLEFYSLVMLVMLVMISCNDVTAYIPSKNLEFYSLVMLALDFWRVYMLLHHYKYYKVSACLQCLSITICNCIRAAMIEREIERKSNTKKKYRAKNVKEPIQHKREGSTVEREK